VEGMRSRAQVLRDYERATKSFTSTLGPVEGIADKLLLEVLLDVRDLLAESASNRSSNE